MGALREPPRRGLLIDLAHERRRRSAQRPNYWLWIALGASACALATIAFFAGGGR
jgi:hypothetical protein